MPGPFDELRGNMLDYLRQQGVNEKLLAGIMAYREKYPWQDESRELAQPRFRFWGRELWEQALAALLAGENLLLIGEKATGKNVLADNLAFAFGRGDWNVSFHINMDASMMLGADTFKNGEVCFRPGPVYACAKAGGFCILDEINMARNEALAALHSLLDYRRILDVPGYGRLKMHPAARFIGTMNYGYAGTRELNEALASRFAVIKLPPISEEILGAILSDEFPALDRKTRDNLVNLFLELQLKCQKGEISSRSVDLRGLLGAIAMQQQGLSWRLALEQGLFNKVQNEEEYGLLKDLLELHV